MASALGGVQPWSRRKAEQTIQVRVLRLGEMDPGEGRGPRPGIQKQARGREILEPYNDGKGHGRLHGTIVIGLILEFASG